VRGAFDPGCFVSAAVSCAGSAAAGVVLLGLFAGRLTETRGVARSYRLERDARAAEVERALRGDRP
jgi:hypothetical protein